MRLTIDFRSFVRKRFSICSQSVELFRAPLPKKIQKDKTLKIDTRLARGVALFIVASRRYIFSHFRANFTCYSCAETRSFTLFSFCCEAHEPHRLLMLWLTIDFFFLQSNKPIMEKRRRARINNCLNELKTLILDAMKKDVSIYLVACRALWHLSDLSETFSGKPTGSSPIVPPSSQRPKILYKKTIHHSSLQLTDDGSCCCEQI